MNGQPCPTQPGEGQAKDLLYKLLLQTAPKLLDHRDIVEVIHVAIKNALDKMVLHKNVLQRMTTILGKDDLENLLILLEGMIEVMRIEKIHSLNTLEDWLNTNKEIVLTKEEVGDMPSSITSP